MENFIYESKTKIIFGQNQIEKLREELKTFNVKNMLFVYGRTAIIKLGIYDKVYEIAKELKINVIEESEVKPNPDVTSVRSGIIKCRENDIDFVFAAGGGSVIDCAKAIAFGVYYDGDVWDVFLQKGTSLKSLPIGVVITLAATGTETNGNAIISNDETNEKRGSRFTHSVPQFAIIDPTYTLSVNEHHTYAGSIDIIMHVLEQFFTTTEHTSTSDYMSIGVMKSVIENTNLIKAGKDSYDVRSNISWASTIALNWILGCDKVNDWATHRLSYTLTREYGTTHGYALARLFSSWGRLIYKYNESGATERLNVLGEGLFNGAKGLDVLDELDKVFKHWGAKIGVKDLDVSDKLIEEMVQNALKLGSVGTMTKIDIEKGIEVYKIAREVI